MRRPSFSSKSEARQWVWDALQREGVARFPFPPHGRIPNFDGAREAAHHLAGHRLFQQAAALKINPDAPQRPLRELALERGKVVYMPTPRLTAGLRCFDPSQIPEERYGEAASLSKGARWSEEVALDDVPPMDLIVAGSVAVTRDGRRAGKGEGYADIEYAILRELGHDAAPVATTVHACQLVGALPHSSTDLPLSVVATPQRTYDVPHPPLAPAGIDWTRLSEQRIEEMPVLAELRRRG